MICRGHVPVTGVGKHPSWVNSDVAPFIRYFLPKGEQLNKQTASKVVRHFHLAFKGMETEEVYDVLMEQLIAALNGYDPNYKQKVKLVVETVENELSKQKQFSSDDIGRYLEFDCTRHLRLLARSGFIQVVSGGKEKLPRTPKPHLSPGAALEGLEIVSPRTGTTQTVVDGFC
jgi:hypothetical protein